MKSYNILIVEDEKEITDGIGIYLGNQGYHIFKAYNGMEGLEILDKETIHLVIVDIMMPIMDGITMVMKLRQTFDFPVIMLSAKSEDMDKVTGLNVGADDYMTKPFQPIELIARVNSHLRRYERYLNLVDKAVSSTNLFRIGGLELNVDSMELTVDGTPVKLTPMEFKILHLLMKYPNRVFSADEIYERVWNEIPVNTDTIMVHIRRIREKIEINPKQPRYLKVVWGVGYKIESEK